VKRFSDFLEEHCWSRYWQNKKTDFINHSFTFIKSGDLPQHQVNKIPLNPPLKRGKI
jgi:hypothetical protein